MGNLGQLSTLAAQESHLLYVGATASVLWVDHPSLTKIWREA
jgi:hypothetical protein